MVAVLPFSLVDCPSSKPTCPASISIIRHDDSLHCASSAVTTLTQQISPLQIPLITKNNEGFIAANSITHIPTRRLPRPCITVVGGVENTPLAFAPINTTTTTTTTSSGAQSKGVATTSTLTGRLSHPTSTHAALSLVMRACKSGALLLSQCFSGVADRYTAVTLTVDRSLVSPAGWQCRQVTGRGRYWYPPRS